MDGLTFYKLMRILNGVLYRSKLNTLSVDGNCVYMSFFSGFKMNLCFRGAPTPPALFKTGEIAGKSPGAIALAGGSSVSSAACLGYERSGFIELKKRKPSGKILTYKCVFEPAGNYANFFLLDEAGVILYSLSSRTIDPDRNIGSGAVYVPPKPNKHFSLDNWEESSSFGEFAGFYPVTAKYADAMAASSSLAEAVSSVKKSLDEDDFFYLDKNSKVVPFAFPGYCGKVSWENLGDFFKQKDKPEETAVSAEKISRFFSEKRDKYLRLAEKLELELKTAGDWDKFYSEACLIKNNLYKVSAPGKYVFQKYTDTGTQDVEYHVERGADIKTKSDKLFKKAARLKRSIPIIEARLEESLQMALSAEEQVYYSGNVTDKDELYAFEKLLDKNIKKPKPSKNKKETAGKPFYIFRGEGFTIYAGRSSYSNHNLVFKFGKDTDIWFHGRNYPSAHVLLRAEGNAGPGEHMLNIAARTAAALSKMKNEKKADIDYTYRKYVNNPKNTPAGFVTYKNFKTVTVEPFGREEIEVMFGIKGV